MLNWSVYVKDGSNLLSIKKLFVFEVVGKWPTICISLIKYKKSLQTEKTGLENTSNALNNITACISILQLRTFKGENFSRKFGNSRIKIQE
jgi:biotin synthase-related radical SAM superfamily protein